MALTPRLDIRQSQTLVMTPQLQQAIKLLQMSNLELTAYIEQEIEKNPLLERSDGEIREEAPRAGAEERQPAGDEEPEPRPLNGEIASGTVTAEGLDTDYENIYAEDSAADRAQDFVGPSESYIRGSGGNSSFDDGEFGLEQTLAEGETLQQHLLQQLPLEIADPTGRLIGQQLIGLLDEAGYLPADALDDVTQRMGAPREQVEQVLEKLQGFDPVGVFARDLTECLRLQLRERDRLDPAMQALLENLELVARRDIAGLCRACGVDQEDVVDMIAEIRALNPKPGLAFGSEVAQTLVPDVYVRQNPEGGWIVELNSETLPRVLVNRRYLAKIAGGARSKDDKAYLSDCLNTANWLVKSLDQRANTILKVATELVRQQDGFFAHGVQHLRPLNLRSIAEAISMHESTVSRVTSNKYIATTRGVYEMKYFFTSAIASADGGEAHSAEAVRQRIRELIDAEEPNNVLSDDRIVEILHGQGIDIARRTVAKYRESLRISSSVQRRRMKQAQG
ncbi:MAG: RNA polymerase factor sigma-54 [Alphaproteobacteria bacterium]|nr:RNA polymerase factor sigma-54 [Alphaproteobacteria bacterium]